MWAMQVDDEGNKIYGLNGNGIKPLRLFSTKMNARVEFYLQFLHSYTSEKIP
jgi:hypothetical protein